MASSSSRKFDSSGSNNPRKKRKSKKGAKTTRALGSARSSSSSIPLSTSADITPRASRPLSGSDSNSRPVSRRRDSRPISRSTSRSTARSVDVTPRRSQDIASSSSVGGSSSPSRLKSKTIAQVDKERRRSKRVDTAERAKKASRVPLIVIGSIVCVIIVTVVALFLMSRTDALEIESVDIKGADHLTQQELNALASIPQGATLLNVDSDSIIKSLMRDSWVESVDVNRVFPSTLEIIIHEREVGAVVEVPSGNTQTIQNWLLSKDAVWLMALPNRESEVGSQISERIYEDAEAALHITNITYGVRPEMGSACTDEPVLNAISILTGLTTELADRIKTVKAEDVEATSLILDSNVEIAVGSANNIREKELICLDILEDNPKVVYINVRVPDRPTWKSA